MIRRWLAAYRFWRYARAKRKYHALVVARVWALHMSGAVEGTGWSLGQRNR